MAAIATLHDGAFVMRVRDDGELICDFRLSLTTPEGEETWMPGWGEFGPATNYAGKGLGVFEDQMRSWFDDHMYDLGMRGLVADRGYDEIPVIFDVPSDLRKMVEG